MIIQYSRSLLKCKKLKVIQSLKLNKSKLWFLSEFLTRKLGYTFHLQHVACQFCKSLGWCWMNADAWRRNYYWKSMKEKSSTCQSRTHCLQENNLNNTSLYLHGFGPASYLIYIGQYYVVYFYIVSYFYYKDLNYTAR